MVFKIDNGTWFGNLNYKKISVYWKWKKRTPKSFSVFSEEGKVLEGAKALHWFAGYFEELLDVPPTKLGDRHHRDETLDCRSPSAPAPPPQRLLKMRRRWVA